MQSKDAPFPGAQFRGNAISSSVFSTNGFIWKIQRDSNSNNLFVHYSPWQGNGQTPKKKGYGFWYSPNKDAVLWGREFNVKRNEFGPFAQQTVLARKSSWEFLDNETGSLNFELDHKATWHSKKHNVVFGKALKAPAIVGSNGTSGEYQWHCELPTINTITDVVFQGENLVYLVGSGVAQLNLKSKETWFLEERTWLAANQVDALYLPTSIGYSVTAGRLFGAPLVPNLNPDIVSGLNSQLEFRNDTLFFAGLENVFAINQKGEKLWNCELNRRRTASSLLYLIGENLLLVNTGSGASFQGQFPVGKPYVQVHDVKTGLIRKVIPIDFRRKEIVQGQHQIGDMLWLFTNLRLLKLDLNELAVKREFPLALSGLAITKLDSKRYLKMENKSWVPLVQDTVNQWLMGSSQEIQVIDEGHVNSFPEGEFAEVVRSIDKYKVIRNEESLFVIDENGEVVGEIEKYLTLSMDGNVLFRLVNGKVYVLNLKEAITNMELEGN